MEARVLNDIMIIKSPLSLPKDRSHKDSIEYLVTKYNLVILFSFGDEVYDLPPTYRVPLNVRSVHYDYDTMEESVGSVQKYLEGFGVGFVSRHKSEVAPLPFLLTGSILTLPEGTRLSIPEMVGAEEPTVEHSKKTWDLF